MTFLLLFVLLSSPVALVAGWRTLRRRKTLRLIGDRWELPPAPFCWICLGDGSENSGHTTSFHVELQKQQEIANVARIEAEWEVEAKQTKLDEDAEYRARLGSELGIG